MRIFFIVNTALRHCAIFQTFNPFQAYCSHFIPPDNIRKSLFFRGECKGKVDLKGSIVFTVGLSCFKPQCRYDSFHS